jgi:putative transcriptional regulator
MLCLDRVMKQPRRRRKSAAPRASSFDSLEGQLLVAMPGMSDKRFRRSVIYMCAHSKQGAMGLIVNQRADEIAFAELLRQLGVIDTDGGTLPPEAERIAVHVGGPVETGRGFVLHTADYLSSDSTLRVGDDMGLTATLDVLKAIVAGAGPARALLALGYSGWSPGQLENEIQANGWLHCPADPDLVFDPDNNGKYDRAMARLGIALRHLSSEAGHA